jgi:nitroreductase
MRSRKSVRSFEKTEVKDALIEKVVEAATFAPTSCNQQLWQFVVVKDSTTKQKLIEEASSSTLISRAPAMIIISYDGWSKKEALQAGAMAVQNMLLAATDLGLGVLAMNSYGDDKKVKRIVGLPRNQVICCFVLLGYPDKRAEAAPIVPRKSVKEVMHKEHFSGHIMPRLSYNPDRWTLKDIINHQRYYCRKTFLGKEMDIMHSLERNLVARELASLKGKVLDILSYDGAYLREFPAVALTTADLCQETAEYSKAAARLTVKVASNMKHIIIEDGDVANAAKDFDAATLIYKLERLPTSFRKDMINMAFRHVKPGGEIIVISRRDNALMLLFLFVIRTLFGDDVRKTGIYSFFGGYKPINKRKTLRLLRSCGWTNVSAKSYFFMPAFFDQALQMLLQYIGSGGSSYLHRVRRENILTKTLSLLLAMQGSRRCLFGSVVVIRGRRKQ